MKCEKVLLINNHSYCKFPKGITNIEEFVKFLNNNPHHFFEIESYVEKGCVAPFFIEEDLECEKQYWNSDHIRCFSESKLTILKRDEYIERLKSVIKEKCMNCEYYIDDCDFESHLEKIDLDGNCYVFERKKS